MIRIMGLDVGERRIGVAVSDPLGITAQGVCTVEREDTSGLKDVVKEYGVQEVVLGLPLNMDGSSGERARDVMAFGEELKVSLGLPIGFWDERLSTSFAEGEMLKGDLSRRKRRALSDKVAAQVILQGYLDSADRKKI